MYVVSKQPTGGILDTISGAITGAATGIQAYRASSAQAALATQKTPTFFDTYRWPILIGSGVVVVLVARKVLKKGSRIRT
ncbi:MAG: hypothetical protein ABH877_04400 [bacterium]